MGIRDRPTSPRSPWQNPYAERLIGTLRRECLDHVLIFDEQHLRRILALYSSYYNQTRTHLALGKDAPVRRAVQGSGAIIATPILFGLHHRYANRIGARRQPVCTENLDSDVLVMKSTHQGMRHDASDPMNWARDRRIFGQGAVRSLEVL
jgi:Integrase core domain